MSGLVWSGVKGKGCYHLGMLTQMGWRDARQDSTRSKHRHDDNVLFFCGPRLRGKMRDASETPINDELMHIY